MCRQANAATYIEEERLDMVRKSIERGAAELRPCDQISTYRTTALDGVSTGLIVCGYRFPDRLPERHNSRLAALITRAIEELRAAPR